VISGSDKSQVVLALGEIIPDFGGQQVVVAYERDGQPLGADQGVARLVVPGDNQGVVTKDYTVNAPRETAVRPTSFSLLPCPIEPEEVAKCSWQNSTRIALAPILLEFRRGVVCPPLSSLTKGSSYSCFWA